MMMALNLQAIYSLESLMAHQALILSSYFEEITRHVFLYIYKLGALVKRGHDEINMKNN